MHLASRSAWRFSLAAISARCEEGNNIFEAVEMNRQSLDFQPACDPDPFLRQHAILPEISSCILGNQLAWSA